MIEIKDQVPFGDLTPEKSIKVRRRSKVSFPIYLRSSSLEQPKT